MRRLSILHSRFSFPLLGLALLAFVQCDGDDEDDGDGASARAGQAGVSGAAGSGARAGRAGSAGTAGATGGTPAPGGAGSSAGAEVGGEGGDSPGAAGAGQAGEVGGGVAGAGGGGAGAGGAGGEAGEGGEGGGDAFSRTEPVHGRVHVNVREQPQAEFDSGHVEAMFYDKAMRMDAFAAYPPELHEASLAGGDCVLFRAAPLQCNPPCGTEEYCGASSQCRAIAALVPSGAITVTGLGPALSLTHDAGMYTNPTFPPAELTAAKTITVQSAGGATPAFSLSAPGVSPAAFDLPEDWSIQLVDGADYVLTWTGAANATVRLLLNEGWHGTPPEASLLCEAPGSAGRITIPAELVEAYPPAGGPGLFGHQSWVSVLQRSKTVVGGRTVELLVTRDRLVQPIH